MAGTDEAFERCQRAKAPGRHHPRRRESAKAPPVEVAIEVRDTSARPHEQLSAEPDFVRSAAAPRGVRPVAVVPLKEVGSEALLSLPKTSNATWRSPGEAALL